jgi:hypothetical protein
MSGIKAVGKYRLLVFRALGVRWKVTGFISIIRVAAWFGVSIREYRTADCLRAPHLHGISKRGRFAYIAQSPARFHRSRLEK